MSVILKAVCFSLATSDASLTATVTWCSHLLTFLGKDEKLGTFKHPWMKQESREQDEIPLEHKFREDLLTRVWTDSIPRTK